METQTFIKRRTELGQKFSRTLFVISAGEESKRSHSVAYRFKVASDFSYLTGLEIQGAALVIAGFQQYLLLKNFSAEAAIWDDEGVLNAEDRKNLSGVQIENFDKLEDILKTHAAEVDRLAFAIGRSEEVDRTLLSLVSFDRRLRGRNNGTPMALCDSRLLVGSLRLIKDQDEIQSMREAAQRSSVVHRRLMQLSVIGKSEREIANWIEAEFMSENMQWTAYQTIVGSGERATLLHARATDKVIREGELVLTDAGGEWRGYCADITRVMSAGRTFTSKQKEIYQVVLDTQKAVLSSSKVGSTLSDLHALALATMTEGLLCLGYARELVQQQITKLMPHSTSHWIGMDVHDPSAYSDDQGNPIRLQAGMCFTVEPGLYIRQDHRDFSEYAGIGMRIEDDVLITDRGCEVLTTVPKEIEEIESLRTV